MLTTRHVRAFLPTALASSVTALGLWACGSTGGNGTNQPDPERSWQVLAQDFPEAALSVDGTSDDDVWVVGADAGLGPLITHFDGTSWERLTFDQRVNLWWVDAVSPELAYAGGTRSTILEIRNGQITRMQTPGLGDTVVFGIWARAEDDVYAVGQDRQGRDGFIWRYDGTSWRRIALPRELASSSVGRSPPLFKVWGQGNETWVVGTAGLLLRSTDGENFSVVETGIEDSENATLFTVHGNANGIGVVGGRGNNPILFERRADGTFESVDLSSEFISIVQGIFYGPNGRAIATGQAGRIFERTGAGWSEVATDISLPIESLHAVWVSPTGDVWAVGGNVISSRLDEGAIIVERATEGSFIAPEIVEPPAPACPAGEVDPFPNASIARRWMEQNLNAIRRDVPRPTVHARTMFHLSAAMWDIWAAFQPGTDQVFVQERPPMPNDLDAYVTTAISQAAYTILEYRYVDLIYGIPSDPDAEPGDRLYRPDKEALVAQADVTNDCLAKFMEVLGEPLDPDVSDPNSAAAFGRRVGQAIVEFGRTDGANEINDYADPNEWQSPNEPLPVRQSGAKMVDPAVWQQLDIPDQLTQNNLPAPNIQTYIGAHWRDVSPFSLVRTSSNAPYFDGGEGPGFGPHLHDSIVEIIEKTAWMDVDAGVMIDVSPGSIGNNSLGANDGDGFDINPITGQPYAPNLVNRADFGRLMAEYWADGPKSETPPGHWNSIAHEVFDRPDYVPRIDGQEVSWLEHDIKFHLALNGAMHDAAIVAWEIKREYVSSRPISLIRYMAELGQSSEPEAPDYDVNGLPLVPGLIERITAESAAPGERHAQLFPYVGELAIFSWRGEPGDPKEEYGGVDWIRALDWVPYQAANFVSPAFPGFTSGHSTYSRAGAEVLTLFTGSEYFPDGLGEFVIERNTFLKFEQGPSQTVLLQFATYYDCADQAGQSRIWGGIHVEPDDFVGRTTGAAVGIQAYQAAQAYFDGTARD